MTDGHHHRRSIRLHGYDYTQAGAYFVTLCAHGRECLFGAVVDGEMRTNPFGQIVDDEWRLSVRLRAEIGDRSDWRGRALQWSRPLGTRSGVLLGPGEVTRGREIGRAHV